MKAISLLQPWASLCVHTDDNGKAFKQIETRSWNTKYRGELLIHASAKKIRLQDGMYDLIDHMQRIGFMDKYNDLPYGAIIGSVNLLGTESLNGVHYNSIIGDGNGNEIHMSHQEIAFGDYSPGRFGWLLSDPVMFDNPIPCKGQLGLWNLPLDLNVTVKSKYLKSIAQNRMLELLKEVYICNDLHRVIEIWNKIVINKFHLSLTEISNARNSIREQILKSTASESDRLKYSNMLRDATPEIL